VTQGFPPHQSGGPPSRGRRARPERASEPSLDDFDDNEDPPWAGQSIYPRGPGRRERRPPQDYEVGAEERAWQAAEGSRQSQEQRWQAEEGSRQAQEMNMRAEEHTRQAEEVTSRAERSQRPGGRRARAEEHTRQAEEVTSRAERSQRPGGRRARAEERHRPKVQSTPSSPDLAWQDEEQEPWAELPARGKGRQAATRARKSRHRLVAIGAVVVIAGLVVAAWLTKTWPFQNNTPVTAGPPLVTSFQRGEFRTVPNACGAISPSLLSQYLPGHVAKVSQSLGSSTQSQCTWTLDTKPNFRVLTVSSQAYAPSLLATGDGSATFNAIDAYGLALQALQNPPKSSKAPKALIGTAVGLGPDALTALQVFKIGGTTDEITVLVRDRNVLITVTMQGQERGGGFGPVPDATLRAAALAAAHETLAGLH
jgi:hypothetical protein